MSGMRRRELITLLGGAAAAWPLAARAQQAAMPVIGFLAPVTPPEEFLVAFKRGLREHGLPEGQKISIVHRNAAGMFARLPGLAAELVDLKVSLIVAWTTPAAVAAKQATRTIPIVIVGVADPVSVGLIDSLARPGGNITGVVNLAADLSGKLLELILEIDAGIKRVIVLWNPDNPASTVISRENETAARSLGLQLQVIDIRAREDLERAFASMGRESATAIVILADPIFMDLRQSIAEFAIKNRLPTVFARRENVEAGGLVSYGPSLRSQMYQIGNFIDKILKGAKPSDLPVEQPTKLELVVNLKTAKALGLDVPWFLQQRADEVIE
jgi:putative tryptophan/tyrosine transport system substrate-binding protein